jgi:hypothetical protein
MTYSADLIELQVSDPWDLVTECGDAPIRGVLRDRSPDEARIELVRPVTIQGRTYASVLVRPRHFDQRLDALDVPVAVNATFLSETFEHGIAAIATLNLVQTSPRD